MYNTTEKVTAVMGFVNIIFCLYTLIQGICGLTVQGFWKMSYSGLFLSVIIKAIIVPLVWVIITIVIQVIFLKGKKTPALFCALLLIPHILGLLVKADAIIASPQNYTTKKFLIWTIVGYIIVVLLPLLGYASMI